MKNPKYWQWLTFFLSRIDPFPRTMILQPVSLSNCLAVIPRGPNILPTKLNYNQRDIDIKAQHLASYGKDGL